MGSIGDEKHIFVSKRVFKAFDTRNVGALRALMEQYPEQLQLETHINAGNWMHVAVSEGWIEGVRALQDLGISIDSQDRDGCSPLDVAACKGNVKLVKYFLDAGSKLDTSDQVRNPLFAAVIGRSSEVAQLLLDAGIDATVRYKGQARTLDAIGFAYYMGADEVAETIAHHLSCKDETKFLELTEQGKRDGGRYEIDSQ